MNDYDPFGYIGYNNDEIRDIISSRMPVPASNSKPASEPVYPFEDNSFAPGSPAMQGQTPFNLSVYNIGGFSKATGLDPNVAIGPYVNQYLPKELAKQGLNPEQIQGVIAGFLNSYYKGMPPKQIGTPTTEPAQEINPTAPDRSLGELFYDVGPSSLAKGGLGLLKNAQTMQESGVLDVMNPLGAVFGKLPGVKGIMKEANQSIRNVLEDWQDSINGGDSARAKFLQQQLTDIGKQDSVWNQIKDSAALIGSNPSMGVSAAVQSFPTQALLLFGGAAGRLGAGGAEGYQTYLDGVGEVIDQLDKLSEKEVAAAYKMNWPDGKATSYDDQRAALFAEMRKMVIPAALITMLVGTVFGGFEASIMRKQAEDIVNKVVGKQLLKKIAGKAAEGIATNAPEEFFQSGPEQFWNTAAKRVLNPDLNPWEGVGTASVQGAGAGGLSSGSIGAAHVYTQNRGITTTTTPPPPSGTPKANTTEQGILIDAGKANQQAQQPPATPIESPATPTESPATPTEPSVTPTEPSVTPQPQTGLTGETLPGILGKTIEEIEKSQLPPLERVLSELGIEKGEDGKFVVPEGVDNKIIDAIIKEVGKNPEGPLTDTQANAIISRARQAIAEAANAQQTQNKTQQTEAAPTPTPTTPEITTSTENPGATSTVAATPTEQKPEVSGNANPERDQLRQAVGTQSESGSNPAVGVGESVQRPVGDSTNPSGPTGLLKEKFTPKRYTGVPINNVLTMAERSGNLMLGGPLQKGLQYDLDGVEVRISNSLSRAYHQAALNLLHLLGVHKSDLKLLNISTAKTSPAYGTSAYRKGSNTHYIRINPTRVKQNYFGPMGETKYEQLVYEIMAHEIGHMIDAIMLQNASQEVKDAIKESYDLWVQEHSQKPIMDIWKGLRSPTAGESISAAGGNLANTAKQRIYLLSFSEWFADQVARWAVAQQEPQTILEKFFKKVYETLQDFFGKAENARYLPADSVTKFLNSLRDAGQNTPETHWAEQNLVVNNQTAEKTIEVDGKERSRLNSEGRPIHSTEEGIRNFWRWFGDSKVVDAEGRPLVMYHATPENLTTLVPGGKKAHISGPAIWFTDNKEYQPAAHHTGTSKKGVFKTGTNVIPSYLRIERPLVIDDKTTKDWAQSVWGKMFPQIIDKDVVTDLQKDYDGIMYTVKRETEERFPTPNEFVVFSSNQIKSALGNSGEFSSKKLEIHYNKAETESTGKTFQEGILRDQTTNGPQSQQSNDNAAGAEQSAEETVSNNSAEYAVPAIPTSNPPDQPTSTIESGKPEKPKVIVKDRQGLLQSLVDDYYSLQQVFKALDNIAPGVAQWLKEHDVLRRRQVTNVIENGLKTYYEPIRQKYVELQKTFGTTKQEIDDIITAIAARNKAMFYIQNNKYGANADELYKNAEKGYNDAQRVIEKYQHTPLFQEIVDKLNPLIKTYTDFMVDEMHRYGRIDKKTVNEMKAKFASSPLIFNALIRTLTLYKVPAKNLRDYIDLIEAGNHAALHEANVKYNGLGTHIQNTLLPILQNANAKNPEDFGLPYLPMQFGDDTTVFKAEKGLSFKSENPIERLNANLGKLAVWGENNFFRQQMYKVALAFNLVGEHSGQTLLKPQPKVKVIKDEHGNVFFGTGVDANQSDMITVWENGIGHKMEITDKAMLEALDRKPHNFLDAERLTATQLAIYSFLVDTLKIPNQVLGRMYTAYSATFAATNLVRDFGDMVAFMPKGISRSSAIKNYPKAFMLSLEAAGAQWAGKDAPAKFQEIEREGGLITIPNIYGYTPIKRSVTKQLEGKSEPIKATLEKADETLGFISQVLENTTRIAIYMAAKDSGLTNRQAAVAAKQTTVNFERSSKVSRTLGPLYLFVNPSIQGARTLVRNLRDKNPNTLQAGAALALIGFLGALFGNDKRDKDGESIYKKIPQNKRDRSIVIGDYAIPLQYGVNLPYVFGNVIGDIVSEGYLHKNKSHSSLLAETKEGATRLFNNLVDVFVPTGSPKAAPWDNGKVAVSEYLVRAFAPTLGIPAVDLALNKNTFGQNVKKYSDDRARELGIPPHLNYQPNIDPMYKNAAQELYDIAGIDVSPSTIRYFDRYLTGSAGEDMKAFIEIMRTGETKPRYEGQNRTPVLKGFMAGPAPFADKAAWDEMSYELRGILKDYEKNPTAERRERYAKLLPLAYEVDQLEKSHKKFFGGYDKAADHGYADIYKQNQAALVSQQNALLRKYRIIKNG